MIIFPPNLFIIIIRKFTLNNAWLQGKSSKNYEVLVH
jgi:hypothetical protein